MKVLVLWADKTSVNLGVRVLAAGAEMLARSALGNNVTVDMLDWYSAGPVRPCAVTVLRDVGRKSGPLKSLVSQYDLVLDTCAGDSFTDIYGLKRFAYEAYMHSVAKAVDVPIIMTPQTIGPFVTRVGTQLARRLLRDVDIVMARDSESARYARSLGRPVDALASDLVFMLPPPEPDQSRDVIVNVSGLLWGDNSHVDSLKYRSEVLTLCRKLASRGRSITILAHVVDGRSAESDIVAAEWLLKQLISEVEFVIPKSLDHARSVISSGEILVGARMHACLNMLSVGKPAIAWSYSRKFRYLMQDIGWNHVIDLQAPEVDDAALRTMALMEDPDRLNREASVVVERARERLDAARQNIQDFRRRSPSTLRKLG